MWQPISYCHFALFAFCYVDLVTLTFDLLTVQVLHMYYFMDAKLLPG